LIGAAVLLGADGAVPGVANIDPRTLVNLYEAASAGRVEETRALQRRVTQLMKIIQVGPPIACIKTALELMAVCPAACCAPTQPLTQENRDRLASLLRELELL